MQPLNLSRPKRLLTWCETEATAAREPPCSADDCWASAPCRDEDADVDAHWHADGGADVIRAIRGNRDEQLRPLRRPHWPPHCPYSHWVSAAAAATVTARDCDCGRDCDYGCDCDWCCGWCPWSCHCCCSQHCGHSWCKALVEWDAGASPPASCPESFRWAAAPA